MESFWKEGALSGPSACCGSWEPLPLSVLGAHLGPSRDSGVYWTPPRLPGVQVLCIDCLRASCHLRPSLHQEREGRHSHGSQASRSACLVEMWASEIIPDQPRGWCGRSRRQLRWLVTGSQQSCLQDPRAEPAPQQADRQTDRYLYLSVSLLLRPSPVCFSAEGWRWISQGSHKWQCAACRVCVGLSVAPKSLPLSPSVPCSHLPVPSATPPLLVSKGPTWY